MDFSNCAEDITPYNCRITFLEIISDLEITLDNLFNWFCCKNFKANAWKCHLKSVNIESSVIEGSSSEKVLGITIDSNLTFEKHINELYEKGNLKLNAFTRCAKFMSTKRKRLIIKAFIILQFNGCPLVWLFHTKQLNNRINSFHKKVLGGTYQDRNSSFSGLMNLDKSVSIHYRNKKYLLSEIYKVKWSSLLLLWAIYLV